jgi:TRAP-type C4-dicarboxylate transport system substrate-binding protein
LLVFNLEFWNKLPKDIQKILQEAALEVQAYTVKYTLSSDIKYREILRDKGLTEVPIAPEEMARWRAKVIPALKAEYVKQIGAAKAEKILGYLPK